ncbi:phosphatidylglycerophosphatase A, partial [Bacillus subtilis]
MSENEQFSQMEAKARARMKERGVEVSDIAELVFFLQKKYHPDLTIDECTLNVNRVLAKREVQNAILTGIELDVLAEQKKLSEPLQTMLEIDESLYGVDEVLAFSIVNIYG